MPSIAPIITINSSPVVEVRGASGISYDEINASIGNASKLRSIRDRIFQIEEDQGPVGKLVRENLIPEIDKFLS